MKDHESTPHFGNRVRAYVLIAALPAILLNPAGDGSVCLASDAMLQNNTDMIILGINYNYSQIKSLKVKLIDSIENRTVNPGGTAERRVIFQSETMTITGIVARNSEMVRDVLIKDDRQLYEISAFGQKEIQLRDARRIVQYLPSRKEATIRKRAQALPKTNTAMDPRELGSLDDNKGLLQYLQEERVVDARSIDRGGERLLVTTEGADGRRRNFYFDPKINFLPTRIEYLDKEGLINVLYQIGYREVVPDSAWFPSEATKSIYLVEGRGKFDEEDWVERTTTRVQGEIAINEEISDRAFALDLPRETRIYDAFKGRNAAEPRTVVAPRSPRALMILINVLVVAGLVLSYAWRRLRLKSPELSQGGRT